MDIYNNVIFMFLFIIPGILFERIKRELNNEFFSEESNFKEIVNGIIYGLPIGIITIFMYSCVKGFNSIRNIYSSLYFVENLILFLGLLLLSFIVITYIYIKYLNKTLIKFKNSLRGNIGLLEVSENTPWEEFINMKNEYRFLEIIVDGVSVKGFVDSFCSKREGTANLKIYDWCYEYEGFSIEDMFTEVTEIYVNPSVGVVIKEYSTSEFNKWYKSLSEDTTN